MRKFIPLLLLFTVLASTTVFGQKRKLKKQLVKNATTQQDIDKNLILHYAIKNKLKVKSLASGVFYVMEKEGKGNLSPNDKSMITAHYHGTTLDGKVFDSSVDRGEPFNFQINRVIKGWQDAIQSMKKGSKGKFLIPSHLAYGERGSPPKIPANAVLIFDIELLDFYEKKDETTIQANMDEKRIKDYMMSKKLEMKKTVSGIYYMIEEEGDGDAHPEKTSMIKAHYKGSLLNGKVFDSSYERKQPIDFELRGVIKGWQEVIPMLKKSGKGKFIIPSKLAYGARKVGDIPANSILVFDIELIDFFSKEEAINKQKTIDDKKIKDYLTKNNLKAQKTKSGIYYIMEKEGFEQNHPDMNSKITAHYHGTTLDGNVFDSSVERGKPFEFQLKGVIKGWQESIPLLTKGAKGKFIIPSHLAYGARGAGGAIGPNTVLIFDIELIDFQGKE